MADTDAGGICRMICLLFMVLCADGYQVPDVSLAAPAPAPCKKQKPGQPLDPTDAGEKTQEMTGFDSIEQH